MLVTGAKANEVIAPNFVTNYDAIIIGAGPNGLAAAVELARSRRSVCIYEANPTIGGGTRSAELTLPGFVHDVCSSVHPLAAGSPFFSKLPLHKYGLDFVYPPLHFSAQRNGPG